MPAIADAITLLSSCAVAPTKILSENPEDRARSPNGLTSDGVKAVYLVLPALLPQI
jgi:hypothetical protein